MADTYVTIVNPLQFMNKSYIQERLKVLGYGNICEIKIITNNEIPKEIELNFVMPELAEKFLTTMNGKSLDEIINHPINVKAGKSDKNNTLSSTKEATRRRSYFN